SGVRLGAGDTSCNVLLEFVETLSRAGRYGNHLAAEILGQLQMIDFYSRFPSEIDHVKGNDERQFLLSSRLDYLTCQEKVALEICGVAHQQQRRRFNVSLSHDSGTGDPFVGGYGIETVQSRKIDQFEFDSREFHVSSAMLDRGA